MSADSENIAPENNNNNKHTLKIAIWLFVLFMFISSDVFIERIMSNEKNTYVSGRHPTTAGTVVQGVVISLGFICLMFLTENNYI